MPDPMERNAADGNDVGGAAAENDRGATGQPRPVTKPRAKRPEGTGETGEGLETAADDVETAADSTSEETTSETRDRSARPKRRRRRGSGRGRDKERRPRAESAGDAGPDEGHAEESRFDYDHEDHEPDDLDRDDDAQDGDDTRELASVVDGTNGMDDALATDDDGESAGDRNSHRGIPAWEEAIGHIIATNMEARAKNPKSGAPRGRGRGGRGKGRGGNNRRP